jgi:hypothetical protein
VRFYGIDPMRLFELPGRVVFILFRQMIHLQRRELSLQRMVSAEGASVPYMTRGQQSRTWSDIKRGLGAGRPKPPPVQVIEHDPDRAREWFERQGIKVKVSDGREL